MKKQRTEVAARPRRARRRATSPPPWRLQPRHLAQAAQLLALAAVPLSALTFSSQTTNTIVIKAVIWHTMLPVAMALLLLARAWDCNRAVEPLWGPSRIVTWALAVFAGVYALSALINHGYPGPLVKHLVDTVCGLATFAVYASLAQRPGFLRRFQTVLLATLFLLAGFALLQALHIDIAPYQDFGWGVPLRRVYASFGNPTYLAGYLALTLPVALAGLPAVRTARPRHVAALTWLLGVAALVCTYSRGGAVGFAVGMAALATFAGIRARELWRVSPLLWIAALALAALVALAGVVQYRHLLVGVLSRLSDASASGRAYIYQGTARMIADRPLLGFGPGTFAVHFPDYWPPALSDIEPRHAKRVVHAHSEFLQIAAETGLLGLAAFSALLLALLAGAWRARRAPANDAVWWLRAGLFAALCGGIVDAAFSVGLRYPGPIAALWTTLGLLAGLQPASPRQSLSSPRWRWTAATAATICALAISGLSVSWYLADRYMHLANALLIRGDDRAASMAETALRYDPALTQARYHLATHYFVAERFADCIAVCDEILRRERYFADVATLLGSACLKVGDATRAAQLFERTVRDEPNYQRGHHYRGIAYLELVRLNPHAGEAQKQTWLEQAAAALERAHELCDNPRDKQQLQQRIAQTRLLLHHQSAVRKHDEPQPENR